MCPRLRHMFRRPMRYRPKHVRQCGVFQGGVRRREAAQKHIRRWDVLVTSAHATQQANETRWGQRVAVADIAISPIRQMPKIALSQART